MKKVILAISLLAMLAGCKTEPFRGFLVHKEYIRHHMDNERPYTMQEAYVPVPMPVPLYTFRDEPKHVPSVWYFYVANKDGVGRFKVDSLTYTRHKVGERIVINQ